MAAMTTEWGYTEDSWQNGWDVLIPWEAELAMRIKEHEEFLKSFQGKGGVSPYPGGYHSVPGNISGIGGAGAGSSVSTTTATSTGGA